MQRILTLDEERGLGERLLAGDREAREILALSCEGRVGRIAEKFRRSGFAREDLEQEGHIGLLRASEDFDHRFGTLFRTYAGWWIRTMIREMIRREGGIVRLPLHARKMLVKWDRAARETGSRDPQVIANRLGLAAEKVRTVHHALVTRSARLHSDGLDEEAAPGYDDEFTIEQIRGAFAALDSLGGDDRLVLAARYGLDGGEALTAADVGRKYGRTGGWVRHVETRAIKRVRAILGVKA